MENGAAEAIPAGDPGSLGAPAVPAADPFWLEAGRLLFLKECRFLRGSPAIRDLPPPGPTEVAFAGRSNVGKSSLLNALAGRRDIARVSNTPGRTQELNFFSLDDRVTLVDLPGYGYAKAPQKKVKDWTETIFAYLKGRATLRRVFLLVDSRHGLLKADLAAMKTLDEAAVAYQVVLTKIDKLTARELDTISDKVAAEAATHTAAHPVLITCSSLKGEGIDQIRAEIAALAGDGA